jgi:hypothetical protein
MRSVNNEEQISAVKRLLVKYQIHRVSARAISKCHYYNPPPPQMSLQLPPPPPLHSSILLVFVQCR